MLRKRDEERNISNRERVFSLNMLGCCVLFSYIHIYLWFHSSRQKTLLHPCSFKFTDTFRSILCLQGYDLRFFIIQEPAVLLNRPIPHPIELTCNLLCVQLVVDIIKLRRSRISFFDVSFDELVCCDLV